MASNHLFILFGYYWLITICTCTLLSSSLCGLLLLWKVLPSTSVISVFVKVFPLFSFFFFFFLYTGCLLSYMLLAQHWVSTTRSCTCSAPCIAGFVIKQIKLTSETTGSCDPLHNINTQSWQVNKMQTFLSVHQFVIAVVSWREFTRAECGIESIGWAQVLAKSPNQGKGGWTFSINQYEVPYTCNLPLGSSFQVHNMCHKRTWSPTPKVSHRVECL